MQEQDCEYMEVDDNELMQQIPNLSSFLRPASEIKLAPAPASAYEAEAGAKYPLAISLFKQEPIEFPPQPPPIRKQQTNRPTCPDEFSSTTSLDTGADFGACAPSIDGFDFLSAEEVAKELSVLGDVPRVPEVVETSTPVTPIRTAYITITLVQDQGERTPTGSCHFDYADSEIVAQLMDKAEPDLSSDSDRCSIHIPVGVPSSCSSSRATSSEHRMYDDHSDSARYILKLHQAMVQEVPMQHAKKKPMLHEFLGYILFRPDDPQLTELRSCIHFCRETGDCMHPQRANAFFKVDNFHTVSEVWRKIKCNSSKDCTKNMKRAMRMSTHNERNYFVNLTQRQHRMQVFKFGERSMEFFRLAFPQFFAR